MHKIYNIHQTRNNASDQVAVLIICLLSTFLSKEIPFLKVITREGTFDVSRGIFSNVISLILRGSDTD